MNATSEPSLIRTFDMFSDLSKYIDEEVEKLDISSITSSSVELHRLFDNASDALVALVVFARKAGILLNDQCLAYTMNSLLRDEHGKRAVTTWWKGRRVSVDVDNLDDTSAQRHAVAQQYGVSEQTVLRYEKAIAGYSDDGAYVGLGGPHVQMPCNHRGCSTTKPIGFRNPSEMLDAEQRASSELWYCHHHQRAAFSEEKALSDELFPLLERIGSSSGLSQKETGATRSDLSFLDSVGLIHIEKIMDRTRLLRYEITLTADGRKMVERGARMQQPS
ncbi:MAG: hypothetical protein EPN70_24910 [Paraburkholderia sp.]|uniref:hypothetical protein n=1 Tax=Paraburkholderia sp. TaxID=1926495 RepID=UPI00120EACDB|nr:hypothetical protein [Paraburkholderia sp.]TAL99547.1 MAG: hypothetical protein EPN70_24910 [Paraburkholderia sp.]